MCILWNISWFSGSQEIQFTITNRGRYKSGKPTRKATVGGYTYTRNSVSKKDNTVEHFECTNRKEYSCPGRISIRGNELLKVTSRHNHPALAQETLVTVNMVCSLMRAKMVQMSHFTMVLTIEYLITVHMYS